MCGLFDSDFVTPEDRRAIMPWVLAGEPEPIVYRSVVGEFHKLGNLEDDVQVRRKKDFHYKVYARFFEPSQNFYI